MNNFLKYWNEYNIKYCGYPITDKGTSHDYINSYYSNEFNLIRDNDIKLVEIGIGDGYSLVLWREWFTNAKIIGIEMYPTDNPIFGYNHQTPFKWNNVTTIHQNAYSEESINLFEDCAIDYLIDDGSHKIEDQLYCLKNWWKKIKVGGKIIIEDILSIDYVEMFNNIIEENHLNAKLNFFDLRSNKNRVDDIIVEVQKIK